LIRRGGVPSGAAAFIATGSMEVLTLLSNLDYPIFMVEMRTSVNVRFYKNEKQKGDEN
jgi:hypothetical protein